LRSSVVAAAPPVSSSASVRGGSGRNGQRTSSPLGVVADSYFNATSGFFVFGPFRDGDIIRSLLFHFVPTDQADFLQVVAAICGQRPRVTNDLQGGEQLFADSATGGLTIPNGLIGTAAQVAIPVGRVVRGDGMWLGINMSTTGASSGFCAVDAERTQ
jgi:hypothetical protein